MEGNEIIYNKTILLHVSAYMVGAGAKPMKNCIALTSARKDLNSSIWPLFACKQGPNAAI